MVCYNSLGLFLSFGVLREMPEGRCVSFAIPFLILPFSRPFFLYGLRFSLDYAVSFKYIALWVLLFLNISSFFFSFSLLRSHWWVCESKDLFLALVLFCAAVWIFYD